MSKKEHYTRRLARPVVLVGGEYTLVEGSKQIAYGRVITGASRIGAVGLLSGQEPWRYVMEVDGRLFAVTGKYSPSEQTPRSADEDEED